jgi:lipoprotein-anchoring transpeptidase ErfK/SrfK
MGFKKLFLSSALVATGVGTVGFAQTESASSRVAVQPVTVGSPAKLARGLAYIRYADTAQLATAPAGPRAMALPRPSPPPAVCAAKAIDVDLTTQQLVATDCGRLFLSTPITSGRAGLRTPTGTFPIFVKEQNVYFYSPWPQGDPNYYPPMFVAFAMEFLDGGSFLHTDPDEPTNAFGPGSEDGQYASHGCVHVPIDVMSRLYAWTGEGTPVTIHD